MIGSSDPPESDTTREPRTISEPRRSPADPWEQGFDHFVRHHNASLIRAAYVLTGDQHQAEDLVQHALLKTYRAWPTLRDPAAAPAYCRRAMYNDRVSWWRKRRIREVSVDPTGDAWANAQPINDRSDGVELRLSLKKALASLTDKQRAVVVLRYVEDYSEAETAELLGVSVGTVKSQTSKALARLRPMTDLDAFTTSKGGSRDDR